MGHSQAFTAAAGEEMGGGVALGLSLLPGWKHPGADAERKLHQPGRSRVCGERPQAGAGTAVFTSENPRRVTCHVGSWRQVERDGGGIQV